MAVAVPTDPLLQFGCLQWYQKEDGSQFRVKLCGPSNQGRLEQRF